jgi:hypothetical protein
MKRGTSKRREKYEVIAIHLHLSMTKIRENSFFFRIQKIKISFDPMAIPLFFSSEHLHRFLIGTQLHQQQQIDCHPYGEPITYKN